MNSNTENLSTSNRHIIDLRCPSRKRSRSGGDNLRKPTLTRNVSDDTEDDHKPQADHVVSSSQVPKKKSRQSFSMSTKISWVKEYQSCPPGTNMRNWLEKKNKGGNTKVSYTSFRRWVMNLQTMSSSDLETYFPVRSKNFVRPHNEMEKVLVEFLRVRNSRLRAAGKRKSTPCYIRAKAKEFFDEIYGDDSSIDLKASIGWLGRFTDSYKHVFDPEISNKNPEHLPADQETEDQLSTHSSLDKGTMGKIDVVPSCHSLSRKDIEYLQELMNELSNL